MVRFSIRVDDDLNTRLESKAAARGVPKGTLAAELIEKCLNGDTGTTGTSAAPEEVRRLNQEVIMRDVVITEQRDRITDLKERVRWAEGEITRMNDIIPRLPEPRQKWYHRWFR